ncbi:transport and Golgi organization protein 1 homolog isoform X2 [Tachysurus fulvidraco]|uniref:transport and Golgi organization protein 1 homolog isoform X2 n=1 Tax=Tachysurus fulvidraco TaxID=1234273 RepID=UPI001FEEBE43|nr:transport and Golgi organization protein 1 homolog isoform X2 [Tachysurus fulvidraco]
MTGLKSRFNIFILFICVCFSKASVDRRFSDFKRCADDDCSMLLCRGKASKDFPGPDCRFLSFKTGETIYVYYKLSGQRSDIWAGSVGNNFGYFPKDFLNINHIYTEKEIEVPAEETDFVCFDTGLDKFESYDVDALLQNSALNEVDEPSDETEELSLSEEPAKDGETEETSRDLINSDSLHTGSEDEHIDDSEDHDNVELPDSETATLASETTASYEKDKDGDGDSDSAEGEGADGDSEIVIPDEHLAKDNGVFEKKTDHITPVEASSQLKTTLGETFDAVTSDDEKTQKVTPYDDDDDEDENQSNDLAEQPIEVEEESLKKPSLLTFEERSHYLEDDVPGAAESEDKHVTLQKGKMPIGDEATKDGETGETSRNVVESHKEDDDGGDLQDSKTNQLPTEAKASYDADYDQEQSADNVIPDDPPSKDDGVFEKKSAHTTPVEASSQLKTTLGETFDAVISDDKYTQKVTPHDDDDDDDGDGDDQSNDFEVEEPVELEEKSVKKPSLLTFDEKSRYTKDNIPDAAMSEDKQPPASIDATKDEGMWSNFGDTVFKIVSGGERTDLLEDDDDNDDDDDDDKEEEENAHTKTTEKDVVDIKTISVHDSETTEAMKPSINDSVKEDSRYTNLQEQNPDVLKYNEELEEIKGKSLEPNEMLINGVESESIPPTSLLEDVKQVLDKPTEKTILKPNPSEIMTQTSEALVREHALDEQIHRVKNEIISVFEGALETEKLPEEPDIEEEEEEHAEELLEDENALLSTKTKLSDEEESIKNTSRESQSEENELSPPKQPHGNLPEAANKNMSEQKTSHDVSSDPEPTLTSISDSATDNGNDRKSDRPGADPVVNEKPEYSDRVRRLTLLREHFKDDEIERILRHLSVKDLYRIEAMFNDLDHQLQSARQSYSQNSVDLENALESILEVSENTILNEIDKMLDAREQRALDLGQQLDQVMIDEEAAILDDFQELAFSLHQKYSASVVLVKESQSQLEMAENVSEEVEIPVETIPLTEVTETPEVPLEAAELFTGQEGESRSQDVGPGEDAGHFNKNEDNQAALQDTTDIQRGPQAILENPLDVLGFEIDPSSDSLDSSRATDFSDKQAHHQASTSTSDHARDFFLLASEFIGVYAEILIAALPEEWQPGPTFHGLPWKPVVVSAVVGVLTIVVFMWRTVLSVKSRMYLLTEKQLAGRIQQLINEKSEVVNKITELNNVIKQHEEKLNNSEESQSSLKQDFNDLKTHYEDLNMQKEKLSVHFAHLCEKIANAQEENKTLTEKISAMHQGINDYQKTLKVYDEERSKVQILMDEAKDREDALKAEVLSFEKDNCALKEQKKSLLQDAKDWQEKHGKLSEEIKVYHQRQTELENALVHKANEIDVLSGCIAELKSLESCNDTEPGNDKNGDPLKLHLKQMMDVSRIKATLSVIEDERNRLFENFMAEQKARQELEEKFQKVIRDQTNLKNEKTHLENQYKNLQQRLEITTELYHQKENILHQKLTQEEMERHEKESKLSEVDGRALQAEEELNRLRQKVKEMQEEMQQNERSLKAEIAVQEKKAHENWIKARASERSLVEERRECANLRQKIVECSDKMSDLEHALYKSGPPDRHMPPAQRADSYGPSPVSGGAPSPPLMMEDPGRPPSGSIGRRSEPFGPRQLLDNHGRSGDLGHPLPFRPEMSLPRTSSPCTQDGSISQKSQRQGSFLPSPIRDSPVPAPHILPKAYGPQPMGGPLPPMNGPLPPAMRPPNGHPAMMHPGRHFGPEHPFRTPHMDSFRPPFPLRPYGPIPAPFVHGPPRRDFPSMGPHPPSHGVHDFPPNFGGPQDLPFQPRPFLPGPPGATVPPSVGAHGPAPPTPLQPREGQEMPRVTSAPPEQRAVQDAPTSTVTQS